MIVRIVSIVPVVPKSVQTIGTTETIAGFHMIVSIASKTEVARSSAMFLGPTTEFWRDIHKTNWRTSIVVWAFCFFAMICITFALIASG